MVGKVACAPCPARANGYDVPAHKRPMAEAIAGLIGLSPDCVSVKAKTNEGMGPLGREDAIACTAIASLVSGRVE